MRAGEFEEITKVARVRRIENARRRVCGNERHRRVDYVMGSCPAA